MHSASRYEKLRRDLGAEVSLFEFPGFGETPPICYRNILHRYTLLLVEELQSCEYDYVIGHSMGGNILLRALSCMDCKATAILLSPVYRGVDLLKPLALLYPFLYAALLLVQKVHNPLTTFCIKCSALLTVNSWRLIDEQIVTDVRRASTLVALNSLIELAWDRWKATASMPQVHVVMGAADRLISRRKIESLPNVQIHYLHGVGHTALLEDYNALFQLLRRLMEKET